MYFYPSNEIKDSRRREGEREIFPSSIKWESNEYRRGSVMGDIRRKKKNSRNVLV